MFSKFKKHNEATTNGKDRGHCIVVTQPQNFFFFGVGGGGPVYVYALSNKTMESVARSVAPSEGKVRAR